MLFKKKKKFEKYAVIIAGAWLLVLPSYLASIPFTFHSFDILFLCHFFSMPSHFLIALHSCIVFLFLSLDSISPCSIFLLHRQCSIAPCVYRCGVCVSYVSSRFSQRAHRSNFTSGTHTHTVTYATGTKKKSSSSILLSATFHFLNTWLGGFCSLVQTACRRRRRHRRVCFLFSSFCPLLRQVHSATQTSRYTALTPTLTPDITHGHTYNVLLTLSSSLLYALFVLYAVELIASIFFCSYFEKCLVIIPWAR